MSEDQAEQGRSELIETDCMVVVIGRQASPQTLSLNEEAEEQETATEWEAGLEMEFQNNLDDHIDQCRICFSPEKEERPIYYPCACKGSIKYMHEDCLLQWLKAKSSNQCEICKHEFTLRYEYAQNTPSRLPLMEVIREIAMKAGRWMGSLTWVDLKLSLILFHVFLLGLSALLFAILYIMVWLWRLMFFESFSELIYSGSDLDMGSPHWFHGLSLLGKLLSGLVIVLMFKYGSDMFIERVWELWLQRQRERARRQRVVEVLDPRPNHVGVLKFVAKLLIISLLLALAVWMFPSLSYSLVQDPAVDPAYGWLVFLGVVALGHLGKPVKQWLSDLHDSIRDDKYLLGQRVQNFETTQDKLD